MIIRSEEIYKKANSIVRSCGTRDTLKIARELGIYVHYIDTLNDLLGMYTYRHKERHILLNSGMEHMVMQMVCGHEIGHDVFHRDLAKKGNALPEFTLFDMRSKPEYEDLKERWCGMNYSEQKYGDILNMPHHVSATRPQMPMSDRAAQFSPFAALTGYDAAIKETGRLTDTKIELDDEELHSLNLKFQFLVELFEDEPEVAVT